MSDIVRLHTNSRMSMAVVHGGIVYLSGQIALNSIGADARTQVLEILERIDLLLAEAGSNRHNILSATIWLTEIAHFEVINSEWEAWLPAACAPARATVVSQLALEGLVVEIAVIAAIA